MYTLYSAPMAIAMAPQAVLEELGQPYDLKMVDVYSGAPPDWYWELNPYGRVPTGLAPAVGTNERGWFYQWLSFLASAVHPASKQVNYPHRCSTDESDIPAVIQAGGNLCDQMYARLEEALDLSSYLLGATFSAADLYMATLASWRPAIEGVIGRPLAPLPRLEDHLARMTEDTGFGPVRAQHEAAWREVG
jgi:glutathione S-transferase